MLAVRLPEIGTAQAWRDAARACLAQRRSPAELTWVYGDASPDLFAEETCVSSETTTITVPRSFIELANTVVWHRDAERFASLYALLWRLKDRPELMGDLGDPLVWQLRAMEKSVRRCQHKMKAFVRFREIEAPDAIRRRFAAWFEPTHHTLEPTAPFFARRFADMDWVIVTSSATAIFEDGELSIGQGRPKPPLPEDSAEDLWSTYFRSIFNPARLKVKAMQSQMPRKYWGNMPETRLIPGLIAQAESRVRSMREAAPTAPSSRAEMIKKRLRPVGPLAREPDSLENLRCQAKACARCSLHRGATQVVIGEGPANSDLMFVGEQPGDQEDLAGRPFVGPAGQLLDSACGAAGIDREACYVTNAVKHFKFTPRGKRRIHQKPNAGEVEHCKWWLDLERRLVRPRLIVALGGTAAEALVGNGTSILKRRGTVERAEDGTPVFLTVHPSYLLRLPNAEVRAGETERFQRDFISAAHIFQGLVAA